MSFIRVHLISALIAIIVFLLVLPLFEFYFRYRTPLPRYCPNELQFNFKEHFQWQQQ